MLSSLFDFLLRTYQGGVPYFSNLFSFHTSCIVQYASEKDTNKICGKIMYMYVIDRYGNLCVWRERSFEIMGS